MTQPNGGPPPTQKTRQHVLRDALEGVRKSLEAVLPKHVTPERMIKVVLSATARQPKLLDCTTASIVRSVMQSAELGLEIGGLLGEAYLVPYNVKIREEGRADRWEKQAQCIPGYRGFIKLARQSGEIATVNARIVYAGDTFSCDLAQETISHVPDFDGKRDDASIKLVYCIVRFHEAGVFQFDVMTKAEVDRIRGRSKSKDDGPWVTDYAEMARKTVARRALKYAPISAERLNRAMELDDRDTITTTGETVVTSDAIVPVSDVPHGVAALEAHLTGQTAQEQIDAAGPAKEPVPAKHTPTPTATGEKVATPAQGPQSASGAPKGTRKPREPKTEPSPPPVASQAPSQVPPPPASSRLRPDQCAVCSKVIDFERDGIQTQLPDGTKTYRHEACIPDPFGVKAAAEVRKVDAFGAAVGDQADSEPPADVRTVGDDDEELQ